MAEILGRLIARGVSDTASPSELSVLEFLCDKDVNRRVFGQPLSGVLAYYPRDYLCVIQASERFSKARTP